MAYDRVKFMLAPKRPEESIVTIPSIRLGIALKSLEEP
jgi:hypothetical protein